MIAVFRMGWPMPQPNERQPELPVDRPHDWDDGQSDEERQEASDTAGDADYHYRREQENK